MIDELFNSNLKREAIKKEQQMNEYSNIKKNCE